MVKRDFYKKLTISFLLSVVFTDFFLPVGSIVMRYFMASNASKARLEDLIVFGVQSTVLWWVNPISVLFVGLATVGVFFFLDKKT